MTEEQKNPWAAAIGSFFIPGWGHVYNGESWIKGSLLFLGRFVVFLACTLLVIQIPYPFRGDFFGIGTLSWIIIFYLSVSILAGLYDALRAFTTARKMNAGILPLLKMDESLFWDYSIFASMVMLVSVTCILAFWFGVA